MPKGAANFVKSSERAKAKQTQRVDYPKIDYFGLKDKDKTVIRFLEQGTDLVWGVSHRVRNGQYFQDIICLDQEDEGVPCPLCQSDNNDTRKRSTKGYINVIWRGNDDFAELNEKIKAEGGIPYALAPVFKRNKFGSPEKNQLGQKILTGHEDGVFLWKCSKTIFQTLLSKDAKYKGLMSRDFEVIRQGAGMEDTTYHIEPFDVDSGAVPMSVGDQILSEKKYDTEALTTPSDYASLTALLTGAPAEESSPESTVEPSTDTVFEGSVIRSSAFGS